jgi:integrase
MARERKGYVQERRDGSIWGRVTYVGDDGKRRELRRRAETRTHAREIIRQLLRDIKETGPQSLEGDRVRFRDLAHIYEETKLIPPEYHGGRKIAGLSSWKALRRTLKTLVDSFGNKTLKSISHADIERYKLKRLKTKTVRDGERAIASVNREMELMRALMRYAFRQGWISRSPFETGSPLISKADEVQRERTLSHEEEARLLAACTGRRAHLRPLMITALDTAMRRGEMFKLRWRNVDLSSREIIIIATNTKTKRARSVSMTDRVYEALIDLWEHSPRDEDSLVFGITDTIKRGFGSLLREAGIDDFRLHDCRHTAITRMIAAGAPPMEVMKISGHTQMSTFARYVNPSQHSLKRAADMLSAFNARSSVPAGHGDELIN